MKIGLTYDLMSEYVALGSSEEDAAEFDRDDTIDALVETLGSLDHDVERIGSARALVARLAAGDRWDLVFNIAEGVNGTARESQVPAILDVYDIPYTFSDPLVLAVCLDKGLAKRVVAAAGVPTAEFAVVRSMADVPRVDLPGPLFVKPIAEGSSKGVGPKSFVEHPADLADACADLLERFRQPVLVERYLPGREMTIGILGTGDSTRAIGALEVTLHGPADRHAYSYANKKHYEDRVRYDLAEDDAAARAIEVACAAWRALGCRDGGRVDIRFDDRDRPCFVEVNPLAGMNPTISDIAILGGKVGLSYRELIDAIVKSASSRVPAKA